MIDFIIYSFNLIFDLIQSFLDFHIEASFSILGTLVAGFGSSMMDVASAMDAERRSKEMYAQMRKDQKYFFDETMKYNTQERKEAEENALENYALQQAYAEPTYQVQRLSAAGINPGAVMDGDAAKSVGSIQSPGASSVSAPSAVQAPQQNPLFNSSSFNGAINALSDVLMKKEQIKGEQINNETLHQRNIAELEKSIAEKQKLIDSHNISEKELRRLDTEIESDQVALEMLKFQRNRQAHAAWQDDMRFANDIQAYYDAHDLSVQQTRALNLANDIQEATGMKLAEKQIAELSVGIAKARAEIGLIGAQKGLTEEQTKHELEKRTETICRKLGMRLDNKQKNMTMNLIKKQLEADIRQKNAQAAFTEFGTSALGVGVKALPALIGVGGAAKGLWKGAKYLKLRYSSGKVMGNTITW